MPSRRFFAGALAALPLGASTVGSPAVGATVSADQITALFDGLPGDKAVKIWAPATGDAPEVLISQNAAKRMFVGSAIKTFVLAEALVQADSPGFGEDAVGRATQA